MDEFSRERLKEVEITDLVNLQRNLTAEFNTALQRAGALVIENYDTFENEKTSKAKVSCIIEIIKTKNSDKYFLNFQIKEVLPQVPASSSFICAANMGKLKVSTAKQDRMPLFKNEFGGDSNE